MSKSSHRGIKLSPIAIVGASIRLAGDISSSYQFWDMLSSGREATEPSLRFGHKGYFMNNFDLFDTEYFHLSKEESKFIDPQHRIMMMLTKEALDDAHLRRSKVAGTETGVCFAIMNPDYLLCGNPNRFTSTGNNFCMVANRVSHFFDLRGPSFSLDSACSSSLISIHLGINSLRLFETDMWICGGINLSIHKNPLISLSQLGVLSDDGRCKAFDKSVDGYGRGEGGGVIILKRLEDAIRDNDRIYSVIVGSETNQNGLTGGTITHPSLSMQVRLLEKCFRRSQVDVKNLKFIEAHGTGTPVGDPIECEAFGELINRSKHKNKISIGSVKTNIGHLETGAGVLGVIKAMLCTYHQRLVPSLHFKEPNPEIDFEKYQLNVQTKFEQISCESRNEIFSVVNSFGYGGSNGTLILQGYDPLEKVSLSPLLSDSFTFFTSARTKNDLMNYLRLHYKKIKNIEESEIDETKRKSLVHNYCYSSFYKTHHRYRLGLVTSSISELVENIDPKIYDESSRSSNNLKVNYFSSMITKSKNEDELVLCVVFPGQGSVYPGMVQDLLHKEPIFLSEMKKIDSLIFKIKNPSSNLEENKDEKSFLIDFINSFDEEKTIDATISNPLIFATQYCYFRLLQHFGVECDCVVGHSLGEVAAAAVSGILTLEQALRVVLSVAKTIQPLFECGSMMMVRCLVSEVEKHILRFHNFQTQKNEGEKIVIDIAAVNDQNNVTVSGDLSSLRAFKKYLDSKKVFSRIFEEEIKYPFHSSELMKKVKKEYIDDINHSLKMCSDEKSNPHSGPKFISCVRHDHFENEAEYMRSGGYWWKNISKTVNFQDSILHVLKERKVNVFLEVSTLPVLSSSILDLSQYHQKMNRRKMMISDPDSFGCVVVQTNFRECEEDKCFRFLLVKLATLGFDNIRVMGSKKQYNTFDNFPNYPWNLKSYWKDMGTSTSQEPMENIFGSRIEVRSDEISEGRKRKKEPNLETIEEEEEETEGEEEESENHQTSIVSKLLRVISSVTMTPIENINLSDPLIFIGLDSLMAMNLSHLIHQNFNKVDVPVSLLLSNNHSLKQIIETVFLDFETENSGDDIHQKEEEEENRKQIEKLKNRKYHPVNLQSSNLEIFLKIFQESIEFLDVQGINDSVKVNIMKYSNVSREVMNQKSFTEEYFSKSFVCHSSQDLKTQLEEYVQKSVESTSLSPSVRKCFVFPGQSMQYTEMGRELFYHEEIFRNEFISCSNIISNFTDGQVIPLNILYPQDSNSMKDSSLINNTKYTQPILACFQISLLRLLEQYEVIKKGKSEYCCFGHSFGELLCLYINEIFTKKEFLRLVVLRGRLISENRISGKMLIIFETKEKVESIIREVEQNRSLQICLFNGVKMNVVGGFTEDISSLITLLETKGIKYRNLSDILKNENVFHHPLFLNPDFESKFRSQVSKVVDTKTLLSLQYPFVSNHSGEWVTVEELSGNNIFDFLINEIFRPVEFVKNMSLIMNEFKPDLILEIGPGDGMKKMIQRHAEEIGVESNILTLIPNHYNARNESSQKTFLGCVVEIWDIIGYEKLDTINLFSDHKESIEEQFSGFPGDYVEYFIQVNLDTPITKRYGYVDINHEIIQKFLDISKQETNVGTEDLLKVLLMIQIHFYSGKKKVFIGYSKNMERKSKVMFQNIVIGRNLDDEEVEEENEGEGQFEMNVEEVLESKSESKLSFSYEELEKLGSKHQVLFVTSENDFSVESIRSTKEEEEEIEGEEQHNERMEYLMLNIFDLVFVYTKSTKDFGCLFNSKYPVEYVQSIMSSFERILDAFTELLQHNQLDKIIIESLNLVPSISEEVVNFRRLRDQQISEYTKKENNMLSQDHQSMVDFFDSNLEKFGDNIAVINLIDQKKMSYHQVSFLSHSIYEILESKKLKEKKGNIQPRVIVVYLRRSYLLPSIYLAIMRSSCSYLPLDPKSYKMERLRYILEDSAPLLIITERKYENVFSNFRASCPSLIFLEDSVLPILSSLEGAHPSQPIPIKKMEKKNENDYPTSPNDVSEGCYVRYTSGSSGRPKGVLVTQRNVLSLNPSFRDLFDFSETSISMTMHSISFDLSSYEIWGALFNGGSVLFVPVKSQHNHQQQSHLHSDTNINTNPHRLRKLLKEYKISHISMTPSSFYHFCYWENMFLEELESEDLKKEENRSLFYLNDLKMIMLCGEKFSFGRKELEGWFKRYQKLPKVINSYGITETTIISTFKEVKSNEIGYVESSIGFPLSNNEIIIAEFMNYDIENEEENQRLRLCPPFVIGEILVHGECLSRGYIGVKGLDLTKKKFRNYEKLCYYRTGDLGYFDGIKNEFIFMERCSRINVKYKGVRIDLNGIAEAIKKWFSVSKQQISTSSSSKIFFRNVLVALIEIESNNNREILVCYLETDIPRTNVLSTTEEQELKTYLEKLLGSEAVPNTFITIPQFPLSGSKKIDVVYLSSQEAFKKYSGL